MAIDSRKVEVQEANKKENSYIHPVQSADTLFHFVDNRSYLFNIIENLAIIPRYYAEDIEYLNINMKKIAYPMICFCDINLHKMHEHIDFYGGYGIAFAKGWGISKGIQPVQYINPKSFLCNDFSEAFLKAMDSEVEDPAQNYLLSQMYYLKPIEGNMERANETIYKNFTDECEWRYIPDVNTIKMPQAVMETDIRTVSVLNNALSIAEECWLKFNPADIKYIIIKSEEDFDQLTETIKAKGLEENLVNRIISKTLVWEKAKGDF